MRTAVTRNNADIAMFVQNVVPKTILSSIATNESYPQRHLTENELKLWHFRGYIWSQ